MTSHTTGPDRCDRCDSIESTNPTAEPLVVGEIGQEPVCHLCRRDELSEETILSESEALVVALKELGDLPHSTIAKQFGLAKSTVDEYNRRADNKLALAKQTVETLNSSVTSASE
ncbi:hypothetical protein [Halosimplex pelagicum]|uniref:Uncharacterized protein n=1 Tax=Halosimplex pelagicum TaxID=869886 RepID=A0A7D5T8R5_9EURY|nr:hypothetical protein [Halosimplex pelagicum]QLH81230.1 hypothetical protein HZS54_06050 [Halosimplex pelagicum]